MTRIVEFLGLGTFSFSSILSAAVPGTDNLIFQLGALGLCAFMVFQNYRQTTEQNKNKEKLIQQLVELDKARTADAKKLSDALERLGEALEDRPCICGDQRIKPK